MPLVTGQTADMLEDSGDFQRAYVAQRIFDELYEHYDEFFKPVYGDSQERNRQVLAVVSALLGYTFPESRS